MAAMMTKAKGSRGRGPGARGKPGTPGTAKKPWEENRFEHERFALIPAAEKWLRKKRLAEREVSLWTAVMPDDAVVSITYSDWLHRVQKLLKTWMDAGWAKAPRGREYQIMKDVSGVGVGLEFGPMSLAAHAVKKDDPEFWSDTGYHAFGYDPDRPPAAVEKILLDELSEFRTARAKKAARRPGKNPESKSRRASAASRQTPSRYKPKGIKTLKREIREAAAPSGENGEAAYEALAAIGKRPRRLGLEIWGDPAALRQALTGKLRREDGPHRLIDAVDPDRPVTEAESDTLHECEETIRRNLGGFLDVGRALTRIRDDRLYRAKFKRFEDYCREVWDFGKAYAYKLIAGPAVVENLAASTIGDGAKAEGGGRKGEGETTTPVVLPATESQVRPLTGLTPQEQVKVWQRVLDRAPRGADAVPQVTAAIVESVVREVKKPGAGGQGPGAGDGNGQARPSDYVRLTRGVTAEIEAFCRHANERMRQEIARFLRTLAVGIEEPTLP